MLPFIESLIQFDGDGWGILVIKCCCTLFVGKKSGHVQFCVQRDSERERLMDRLEHFYYVSTNNNV